MKSFLLFAAVSALVAQIPAAQAQHQPRSHAAPSAGPYSGLESRAVKSLSDREIADLRAGRGMGLALAAELNGYPGPVHVLELAQHLQLSETQRSEVEGLQASMTKEAIPLGERLIAEESELDRLFATRAITPASLASATTAIGSTQAALRATHLKYHLATAEVLSPEQVRTYNMLRGYGGMSHNGPAGSHHRK
jgi:hypothetical protein